MNYELELRWGLIDALRTLKCQRQLCGMAIEGTIKRKQHGGIEVNRKERKHGLELGIIIDRLLKRKAQLHLKMAANQSRVLNAFVDGNRANHLINRHVVCMGLAELAKEVNGITCFAPLDTEAEDVLTRDKRAVNSESWRFQIVPQH